MTRVTHRLSEELGTHIPLPLLFEHPVLTDLATHLPQAGERHLPIPVATRTPNPDGTITLPASSGQKRLWLLCSLDPRAHLAYHLNGGAKITGPLDAQALAEAIRDVARHHEILRTTLREENGDIVQVVHPTWRWDPDHDPRRGHDPGRGRTHRRMAPLHGRPRRRPPVPAHVVRQADDQHLLLLSLHHTIADGWTLTLLLDEIARRYAELVRRPTPRRRTRPPVR